MADTRVAIDSDMAVADSHDPADLVFAPPIATSRRCGMPTKRVAILAVACGLSASLQPVHAQTVATGFSASIPAACRFSQPARIVTSLRSLPDVAAEFRRQKLDIADVGEKFIPFDVEDEKSRGLPHRQFVRGYVFADRTLSGPPCAATEAILAGVDGGQGW